MLTSGQKNFRTFSQTVFFELNFLFNCVEKFSKTVRKPVTFFIFIRYLCISNVYLMLGETYLASLQLETILSTCYSADLNYPDKTNKT